MARSRGAEGSSRMRARSRAAAREPREGIASRAAAAVGDQIAGMRRRGMSLAVKFGLIIGALVVVIGLLWGTFAVRATRAALDGRLPPRTVRAGAP